MEEYQEYSLGGRVFQKIREDILKGKYKEHEELREYDRKRIRRKPYPCTGGTQTIGTGRTCDDYSQ